MCANRLSLAQQADGAWPASWRRACVAAKPGPDNTAAILFTSGTEGEPKGVALSHENILANVAQVRAHIDLYDSDVLFNPLPVFHCFGLTVGTILPLIAGVKVVCHPTPLQPREIVRRIREHGATILLSTDTFINQYARAGEPAIWTRLRLAVCGAERVRDETRALSCARISTSTLLEGYGVTEASPVVAANQIEANHPGTVGRLMAGMEARLEPVEGIPGAGELHVKGPNVMLGYIKPDAPGKIVPPPDGWYNTGDVVSIDEDGFIAIRGRLKRFAKIGGETVSLAWWRIRRRAVARQCPCRRGGARWPQGRADRAGDRCARSAAHGPDRLGAESRRFGDSPCRAEILTDSSHSGAGHRQDRLCRGAETGRSRSRLRPLPDN